MSPAGIEIRDKMDRRQKLKTLCETRWASQSYSLFTILSAFLVVCSSFEELEHGCDAKRLGVTCAILQNLTSLFVLLLCNQYYNRWFLSLQYFKQKTLI